MKRHAIIYWLILSCCVLGANTCSYKSYCRRQQFYKLNNTTYEGDVILRIGQYHVSDCQRVCRIYLECQAFSMEGTDDNFGTCSVYRGAINMEELMPAEYVTLYTPCPKLFHWVEDTRKCYTTEVKPKASWNEAIQGCKQMYPGSRLPEPRNAVENQRLLELSNGLDMWLGLYRPSTSDLGNDIHYASDGKLIYYSNWGRSEPNNVMSDEDCIKGHQLKSYVWYDTDCDIAINYICEI